MLEIKTNSSEIIWIVHVQQKTTDETEKHTLKPTVHNTLSANCVFSDHHQFHKIFEHEHSTTIFIIGDFTVWSNSLAVNRISSIKMCKLSIFDELWVNLNRIYRKTYHYAKKNDNLCLEKTSKRLTNVAQSHESYI